MKKQSLSLDNDGSIIEISESIHVLVVGFNFLLKLSSKPLFLELFKELNAPQIEKKFDIDISTSHSPAVTSLFGYLVAI